MAIKDTYKKPFIEDRDSNVSIGLDLPIHKSAGGSYFKSTKTTIDAVKVNIKNLLNTHTGERLMQPTMGINLRSYLFEQFTEDISYLIKNDIIDLFKLWLPFVEVRDVEIEMEENDSFIGKNKLNILLKFNIKQDPNTLESVDITITGEE